MNFFKKTIIGILLLNTILFVINCKPSPPKPVPIPTVTPEILPTPQPAKGIIIEAEDYTGYYDTTKNNIIGNQGKPDQDYGKYRDDDVDIEDCYEGGFNICWSVQGEWLEYTFNKNSNTYVLWMNVALGNKTPSEVKVFINDKLTITTNITSTGDWQWWETQKIGELNLNKGDTVKILFSKSAFNIDYLFFTLDKEKSPPSRTPIPTPENYIKPVSKYGQLHIDGTQIVDENNNSVQLKGVNGHHIRFKWWNKDETIQNLAYELGIEIVRIPHYVEKEYQGCLSDKHTWEVMIERTKAYIEDAIEAGIYIIVDWHVHTNPNRYTEKAVEFFQEIAVHYGNYPNIIWEVCNEPSKVSWEDIKSYAEYVIPLIRNLSPNNIIVVGTPNWSQYVDEVINDPIINYDNIMYALHFYADSHKQSYRDRLIKAIEAGLPIIVTEWGTTNYDVNKQPNYKESELWLELLNLYNISWINWSFIWKKETASWLKPKLIGIGGEWNIETDFTETGKWVYDKIKN